LIWTVLEGDFSNEVDTSILFGWAFMSSYANAGMFIGNRNSKMVSRVGEGFN